MKTIFFITSIIVSLNYSYGQCFSTEQEYKDYFEANIQTLDPIEGIWSSNYTIKSYYKGESQTNNLPNNSIVYIIKKDGGFHICGLKNSPSENKNFTQKTEIKKTAIEGVYLYSKEGRSKITGAVFAAKANAILTDQKILEYSA